MQPIVTDRVAWSVGLSVGLSVIITAFWWSTTQLPIPCS